MVFGRKKKLSSRETRKKVLRIPKLSDTKFSPFFFFVQSKLLGSEFVNVSGKARLDYNSS